MKFWADIDNAPHVLVLRPLIAELERLGHQVEITARDYGQTIPLLAMYGMRFTQIGKHWGKNRLMKYLSILTRSVSLLFYSIGRRFDGAFCHGARAILFPAHILNIPLVVLSDYEYAELPEFVVKWARLHLHPDVIPSSMFSPRGDDSTRHCGYPGLKEDLYIHDTTPDQSFISDLGMDGIKVIVLIRPPATMAHYAIPESGRFFYQVLDYFCSRPKVQILLFPRTGHQENELRHYLRDRGASNVFFPNRVYDGPGVMQAVDLIISGGGTMNREAATLGVPVYSIYQGPIGAVDQHLIASGRLKHLRTIEMVSEIPLIKRKTPLDDRNRNDGRKTRAFIVEKIIECSKKREV